MLRVIEEKIAVPLMLVITALVLGGIFWSVQSTNQEFEQATQQPELKKSEFRGWQTYRNEEFGFEFRYPGEWNFTERDPSLSDGFYITSPDYNATEGPFGQDVTIDGAIVIVTHKTTSLSNISELKFTGLQKQLLDDYGLTETKVSGFDAIEREWEYDGDASLNIEFIADGLAFNIFFNGETKNEEDSKYFSTFNQILSTFKFIEPTDTSDWQTFTNTRYEYSFQYPNDFIGTEIAVGNGGVTIPASERSISYAISPQNIEINITPIDPIIYGSSDPPAHLQLEDYVNREWSINKDKEGLQLNPITGESNFIGELTETTFMAMSAYEFVINGTYISSTGGGHIKAPTRVLFFVRDSGLKYKITLPANNPLFENILSTFKFIESDPTENWQTYRNEEFGFEFRYPEEWEVFGHRNNGDTELPPDFTSVYKPEKNIDTYGVIYSNFNQINIMPIGGPGGQFPVGESRRIINRNLTEAQENYVIEYYTDKGLTWGYIIYLKDKPQSWYNDGFIFARTKIDGMKILYEKSQDAFQVPIQGEIVEQDLNTIEQILSTFKFLE